MAGLMDIALNLASSKSGAIAKKIGKSPEEVKQALEQGKQILAQNQSNLNADGARKIFANLGIPPAFLDKAYSMAAPLAGFVPGVDAGQIKSAVDTIKSGMVEPAQTPSQQRSNVKFDKAKYPKI